MSSPGTAIPAEDGDPLTTTTRTGRSAPIRDSRLFLTHASISFASAPRLRRSVATLTPSGRQAVNHLLASDLEPQFRPLALAALAPIGAAGAEGAKVDDIPLEELDKGGKEHVVSAPFFGPHANEKEYPPFEFLNDYREFFRSYRAAFAYWLRTAAAGEESPEKFAAVLRGLAGAGQGDGEGSLDQLLAETYGLPVSAADGETESLEWQFLDWISKTK